MGKSASTPPAPDYTSAAQATATGNMISQVTPYGSLTYKQTGADTKGNPMFTATTSLSPDQQQLLNQQTKTSLGLGNLQQQGLGYVQNMLNQPFDTSQLAQTGINPGQTYSDAIMQRLQPQMQMQEKQFDAQMANQGIMPGSEAYTNAYRDFKQGQNDQLTSAIVGGMQTGMQARQQGFNELAYQRNEPINTLNAVRSGSQVTNPAFTTTPAGPDYLGATQAQYNAQLGAANAQNAANNAMTSGLFSLGGAALMSDIRTKENIKAVGWLPNGLPVYEYEYKPEFKVMGGEGKFIGVMAQDVEKVQPEAVFEINGIKIVNYGVLNA